MADEQEPKTFTLNYKGKDVECDKSTGQVVDRAQLGFPMEAVVKFQGGTDNPDWKDLKVCLPDRLNVQSLTVPGENPHSDHKTIHGFPSRSYRR